MRCDDSQLAHFTSNYERKEEPSITLCENHLRKVPPTAVFGSVAHELIHAYDFCRADFDYTNLDHLACTEVRTHSITNRATTLVDSVLLYY
jgi:hypothetical protein